MKKSFDSFDKLNRKSIATDLINVALDSDRFVSNGSLVIALDATWGNGKSTFTKCFKNLSRENMQMNSMCLLIMHGLTMIGKDPFIPLVNSIIKHNNTSEISETLKIDLKEKALKIAGILGKGLLKTYAKRYFGEEISEISSHISKTEVDPEEALSTLTTSDKDKVDYFAQFELFSKLKEDFKGVLRSLSEEKKMIFFIDELDRYKTLRN